MANPPIDTFQGNCRILSIKVLKYIFKEIYQVHLNFNSSYKIVLENYENISTCTCICNYLFHKI